MILLYVLKLTYALDTNVLISMAIPSHPVRDKLDAAIADGSLLVIPRVVHYEMLRGFLCYSAPAKEKSYSSFCSIFPIGKITEQVWQCATHIYAELHKKHFTVKDADILIAAFCLVNGYTLVTDNTKDFENINDLQMVNWAEPI